MVIAAQAVFLVLGSFLSRSLGATLVETVGVAITISLRLSFALLTIAFALIYGFLIDGFVFILCVKSSEWNVRVGKLVIAVTLSTAITGLLATIPQFMS